MSLEYFDAGAETEEIVAALRRDGAVVLRRWASAEIADSVAAELRPYFDSEGTLSQNDFNGYKTLRVAGILARSQTSAELIAHPRLLEILDAILLPHCIQYQIGSTTGIEIHPGEDAQRLHTDDVVYPVRIPGMELQVSANWALDDFSVENGTTRLVPGSHSARSCCTSKNTRSSRRTRRRARPSRISDPFSTAAAPTAAIGRAWDWSSPTAWAGCARRRTST